MCFKTACTHYLEIHKYKILISKTENTKLSKTSCAHGKLLCSYLQFTYMQNAQVSINVLISCISILLVRLLGARIMYVLGTLDRVFDKFKHFLKILRFWFMTRPHNPVESQEIRSKVVILEYCLFATTHNYCAQMQVNEILLLMLLLSIEKLIIWACPNLTYKIG